MYSVIDRLGQVVGSVRGWPSALRLSTYWARQGVPTSIRGALA